MSEVLQLANARLVLTDRVITGRILIIDGQIDVIEEGDIVPNGAVNCQGDYVMPGLVELHTGINSFFLLKLGNLAHFQLKKHL